MEAVSVTLVRALARLPELEIDVLTSEAGLAGAERECRDGATIHRLPRTARRILWEAVGPGRRQMRRQLDSLRPDLIHSHDVYGLMVQGHPVPRVFTVHGFIHADTRVSGEGFPRLRSWLWRLLETRAWADQQHVISISPYVKENLAGHVRGRIHEIENPVAESFFEVKRREEAGTVFCAGLIERRKNAIVLVEALARLRARGVRARLRLAGSVRESDYARRLAESVSAAGLAEHVEVLGSLSSGAVREELARASVFALVSLEENAPMGIAEAMAAGVPVVASNRCGMPYMVRHGESGFLVDPLDSEDVANRLAAVLAGPGPGRAMGEVGRAIALERFHPDVVARKTLAVYLEATGSRRG